MKKSEIRLKSENLHPWHMKFYPYEKGGQKSVSHADGGGGGGTTSFEVVFTRQLKV